MNETRSLQARPCGCVLDGHDNLVMPCAGHKGNVVAFKATARQTTPSNDITGEWPAMGQDEREPDHSAQMLSWVLVLVVMLVYGGMCVWLGTRI